MGRRFKPSDKNRIASPRVFPGTLSRPAWQRWLTPVLAALLLSTFAGLSIWEMWDDSVTIDERVYLPAGYVYWTHKDFSLNPEHPPLVKLLAAIPLLGLDVEAPALDSVVETNEPRAAAERQMAFGSKFLYSQDADRIIFWGRLPMVALGLLLGTFIFRWSWEIHGHPGAGLLSLFLFTLEPTLLAHSHYVTTDVAPACFSVMAMYFLWRFGQREKASDLLLSCLGLGLALGSKYSAVFMVPVYAFWLFFYGPVKGQTASNAATHKLQRVPFMTSLGALLVTAATVQATYLFSPDLLIYFKGLRAVNASELPQSLLTYVNGDFISGGVWWYHLYVMLLKLPLPTIIVILMAGGVLVKRRELLDQKIAFTLLPAAVFALVTCALANNLGARYMIPVVAFLLVVAGRAWFIFAKNGMSRIIGAILAFWLAISVFHVSPHHISYFNELVGGSSNGAYFLDDSNIDWGQDFNRLMRYLDKREIKEAVLSYWGPMPPDDYLRRYGIRFTPWTYEMAESPTPPPGFYEISVNQLIGIKREKTWLKQPLDAKLDWLNRFQPYDRVGYSIYIYNFPPLSRR